MKHKQFISERQQQKQKDGKELCTRSSGTELCKLQHQVLSSYAIEIDDRTRILAAPINSNHPTLPK
jgi:hypothetical protein